LLRVTTGDEADLRGVVCLEPGPAAVRKLGVKPIVVLQLSVVEPEMAVPLKVVIICAHSYVPASPDGEVALALNVMPGVTQASLLAPLH